MYNSDYQAIQDRSNTNYGSRDYPTKFGDIAETLHSRGYSVVPIRPGTKAACVDGWPGFADKQDEADVRQLIQQYPNHGLGIVTGHVVGIDIDVLDTVVAAEIAELAKATFGPGGLARTGRAPKITLVYHTEDPFPGQKSRRFQRAGEQQTHRVEIQGNRQQFVAFAIHPGTDQPYKWFDRSPLDTNLADLPAITEDQIREFIVEAERILLRHGFQPVKADTATTTTLLRPSAEVIPLKGKPPTVFAGRGTSSLNAAAQANMPAEGWFDRLNPAEKNDLLQQVMSHPAMVVLADAERSDWLKIIFALADAEQRETDKARAIALAWSKSSPRFRNETDFQKDWRSFRPKPGGITIASLLDVAEKAGIDLTRWRDGMASVGATNNNNSFTTVVDVPTPFFRPIPFDQASLRPAPWLIPGLLLRGEITVIAGQGGGAKTAFAVALGVAVSAGMQRLGPFDICNRPGGLRAGFISGEEDHGRLGMLVAGASQVAALNAAERAQVATNLLCHDAAASGWRLGEPRPGHREDICPETNDRALNQLAATLGGFDIVILDTLAALFALPNENDNSTITTLLRRLTRAARQAACAVLLLHHTPKLTREGAAQQRGEATLVRGGSAITNSARVVLTITTLTQSEGGAFVVQGFTSDRLRRIEHAKINDMPPMEPAYFEIRSEKVKVYDGSEHAVRAIEFIAPPPTGAASIPDAVRNVVMKAIDAGTTDEYGATVPLSPGGGANNRRDAISHITKALMNAKAALTEVQAKGLARETLKDMRDRIGCVTEQDVTIPQYKKGGQPNGNKTVRGLGTRWDLAPWATKPTEPHCDAQPIEGIS